MVVQTVSAALVNGLLELAVAKGAGRQALLLKAGISSEMLSDQDDRIPLFNYVSLMRAGKVMSSDPALALHYGEAVDLSDISVVGLIGRAAPTLLDALAQLNRYGKLVIDVALSEQERFERVVEGGGYWMVDRRADPDDFPELTEATFARMICGVRRFAPELRVEEVHVTHAAPAHADEYERILGAPVTFGSHWNAYRTDASWMNYPLNLQPQYVFGILRAHADDLVEQLDRSGSVARRVEEIILPLLHTGQVAMDNITDRIGLSRQTLYRRLKAEGTTFEQVLDALRHRLALQYLQGSKVSVNETAYLVGFNDPAAFSHAFKRWTGMSPRNYRNSIQAS
jgi:AraC-like DNA-binding protein